MLQPAVVLQHPAHNAQLLWPLIQQPPTRMQQKPEDVKTSIYDPTQFTKNKRSYIDSRDMFRLQRSHKLQMYVLHTTPKTTLHVATDV